MDREEILEQICRIADENDGRPPGKIAFQNATGVTEAQWSGVFWARWSDALKDAGFEPNKLNPRLPKELVLKHFAQACRTFGKVPTMTELRLYSRRNAESPSHNSFVKPFGNKAALLRELHEFVDGHSEYSDIAGFLPEKEVIESNAEEQEPERADGWVYLMKSSKHYKIGRSDNIEKRFKEISVALPEKVTLDHAIRTDDPPGIEAYWHRRFAEYRANGEWFELPKSAVRAFKRRKFM